MGESNVVDILLEETQTSLPSWLCSLAVDLRPRETVPETWHLVARGDDVLLSQHQERLFQVSTERVARRLRTSVPTELLKACDVQPSKRILDGFGGWGVDGLTMAMHKATVTICEINPFVHVLQCDLSRRLGWPARHVCTNVLDHLRREDTNYDVVYLDPMFPTHSKGAKPSRDLQILAVMTKQHGLAEVFDTAMQVARERVVVKRRRVGDNVVSAEPSWSITGRSVRFDVYNTT